MGKHLEKTCLEFYSVCVNEIERNEIQSSTAKVYILNQKVNIIKVNYPDIYHYARLTSTKPISVFLYMCQEDSMYAHIHKYIHVKIKISKILY